MKGYGGKILFIDVGERRFREEVFSYEDRRKFLGGFSMNSKLLWDSYRPDVHPFSEESVLVLGAGPFVGTLIPGSSKLCATSRFPLTMSFGTACAGSRFGFMLKTCGYDHVVVRGKADKPTVIVITDEGTFFEDGTYLWGKRIFETTDELIRKYEPAGILPIGPSAENLVNISITLVDKMGTLGSGGLPSILGSKNIKAIVVRQGRGGVEVSDKSRLLKILHELMERIRKWGLRDEIIKKHLTPDAHQWWLGSSPLLKSPYEVWEDKTGDEEIREIFEQYVNSRKSFACPSCPIADKDRIDFGKLRIYASRLSGEVKRFSGREDLLFKLKFSEFCDDLGICFHTFWGIYSALLSLYEEGVIKKEEIGFEPYGEGALELIRMISYKEGIGEVLSYGFQGLLNEYGERAQKYIMEIKGRYPMWDPRIRRLGTMEFGEITNPRGSHLQAGGSPAYNPGAKLEDFVRHADRMGVGENTVNKIKEQGFDVGRYTKYSEDWFSLLSSLGICNRYFINRFYNIRLIEELFSSLTGEELSREDLMGGAERGWNILRAMNYRVGFGRDKFPDKWLMPLKDGRALCDYFGREIGAEDMERFLDNYYDERGWERDGKPKREKLKELSLYDVERKLYGEV